MTHLCTCPGLAHDVISAGDAKTGGRQQMLSVRKFNQVLVNQVLVLLSGLSPITSDNVTPKASKTTAHRLTALKCLICLP